ncbi:MAG: ATP-binding protein, partial [Acidimicrobiia bacterium]
EFVVTGPASTLVAEMEGTADAGEIVISHATAAALPVGSAKVAKGGGWILSWRKPRVDPCGVPAFHLDCCAVPGDYLSAPLRDALSVGAADSEHRLATVVFIKVFGTDSLIRAKGSAGAAVELEALVAEITRIADDEEITFLGTDVDESAFKIILVAGVPTTSVDEDGAALRAARRIGDIETSLALKIGVNGGHVFTGEVGTSDRSTYTIMGDTVNLAARLMAAAPTGSIYVSPQVADGSRSLFATNPVEAFHVKGKTLPVQAVALGELTGTRAATDAGDVSFVGRTDSLEQLRLAQAEQAEGTGAHLHVVGPAGIGKTRLLLEAFGGNSTESVALRAEPYGASNPYRPFRDPLRRLLAIERGENAEMAAQLLLASKEALPESFALAPLLGDIAQIDVPDTDESAAIDARFRQDRTIDVFLELLASLRPGPLHIEFEDAHWADAASLALLEKLGAATASHPWTVVVTQREHPDDVATALILQPLSDDDAAEVVHAATEAAPFRPDVVDAIVDRAGGNPLFLLELVKVARETGDAGSLPTSLDGVVGSQIDSLEPLARRVLMYVSVLGRSFRTSVARELLASQDIHLDEATRERLTDFLEDDGPDRLRFRHTMVQDAAYEGLSYRRRAVLHREAAEMVLSANEGTTEGIADILSLHFFRAGDFEKAWEYSRQAGERARDRYANAEAEALLVRALASERKLDSRDIEGRISALNLLGDVREASGQFAASLDAYRAAYRSSSADPLTRAEIMLKRCRARERAGDFVQALAEATRCRKLVAGDTSDEAQRIRARSHSFGAVIRAGQQKPRQALAEARSSVEFAQTINDEEALARSWVMMDWAYHILGSPEKAVYSPEALRIHERRGNFADAAGVSTNLGVFAYFSGDWNTALDYYSVGYEASVRAGNMIDAAMALLNTAEVLTNQGRFSEALAPVVEAHRIVRASEFEEALVFVDLLQGRIEAATGSSASASHRFQDVIASPSEIGVDGWRYEAGIHLADISRLAGDHDDALQLLDAAESEAPSEYRDLYAPFAGRIRGLTLIAQGNHEGAATVLTSAFDKAREGEQPYESATITMILAKVPNSDIDDHDYQGAEEVLRSLGVHNTPSAVVPATASRESDR